MKNSSLALGKRSSADKNYLSETINRKAGHEGKEREVAEHFGTGLRE